MLVVILNFSLSLWGLPPIETDAVTATPSQQSSIQVAEIEVFESPGAVQMSLDTITLGMTAAPPEDQLRVRIK